MTTAHSKHDKPELITVEGLAHRWSASEDTIRMWARDGKLPPHAAIPGALKRWSLPAIRQWERENGIAPPATPQQAEAGQYARYVSAWSRIASGIKVFAGVSSNPNLSPEQQAFASMVARHLGNAFICEANRLLMGHTAGQYFIDIQAGNDADLPTAEQQVNDLFIERKPVLTDPLAASLVAACHDGYLDGRGVALLEELRSRLLAVASSDEAPADTGEDWSLTNRMKQWN